MNTITKFFNRNFNYKTWVHHSGEVTYFLTLFGITFIRGWAGNLISPCVHWDRLNMVTIRLKRGNEIHIYLPYRFSNGKVRPFNWNWDWIARTFGKSHEAPFGTVWVYEGILGHHQDI